MEIDINKISNIKDFSFGFINNQSNSANCEVVNAKYDKFDFKIDYEKLYKDDAYFEKNYNFITLVTK